MAQAHISISLYSSRHAYSLRTSAYLDFVLLISPRIFASHKRISRFRFTHLATHIRFAQAHISISLYSSRHAYSLHTSAYLDFASLHLDIRASHHRHKKKADYEYTRIDFLLISLALVLNAYIPICFATSSAKFSSFFSIPSPVSKRTNFFNVSSEPVALATSAIY